jgi:hypothetical protein
VVCRHCCGKARHVEICVQIKSFKHAEHKSFGEVLRAIVPVLLEMVPAKLPESKLAAYQTSLKSVLTSWGELLRIFTTAPGTIARRRL